MLMSFWPETALPLSNFCPVHRTPDAGCSGCVRIVNEPQQLHVS